MTKTISSIFTPDRAALAPLAGVTDSVFRRLCAELGASPVMTEMISCEGFVRGKSNDKTSRMLRYHESERPIGFQLFGSDPDVMGAAAAKALDLKPDFFDINAGCPVKKVVTKGAGSALLQNPGLLSQIVERVVATSHIPVSVKIRSGWDCKTINAVEIAQTCVDSGAQGIIVHPRTRAQGFSGNADWTVIRDVKEAVSVPVIGSGDIHTPEDAQRMRDETGADCIMIGRAAMNNPWIFRDTACYFKGSALPPPSTVTDRLDLALRQLDLLSEEVAERFAVVNMRKFFGWYSRGSHDGAEFRRTVFRAETKEDVVSIVREFQESIRKNHESEQVERASIEL